MPDAFLFVIRYLHSAIIPPPVRIFVLFAAAVTANAQFKVVGPAPVSPAVARQQMRTALDKVDPGNSKQTIQTLSSLLAWYRDILDEELIAAWRKDPRDNLTDVMEALADSRVATGIVQFSWREQRATAFQLSFAPMFGQLMVRFPESAQPFLDDLLGPIRNSQQPPDLAEPQAETVCRILLDMPDVGTWRKTAVQILPHYRQAAESLLAQDLRGGDHEKSFRAQVWQNDLQVGTSASGPAIGPAIAPTIGNDSPRQRRRAVSPDYPATERPAPRTPPAPAPEPVAKLDPSSTPPPPIRSAPTPPSPPATPLYQGERSGTLESSGAPIPQNAEYVFRNLPPVPLKLDYDTKTWDARLSPGEGQTQRLIVKNKSSSSQKHCVVHWTVIP